jgi:hypothetical protein
MFKQIEYIFYFDYFIAAESNFVDAAIAQKGNNSLNTNKGSSSNITINTSSGVVDTSNEYGKELEPFPFDDEEEHNNTGSGSAASVGIDDEPLSQQMNGLDLDNGLENSSNGTGWCAEDMLMTNQTKYGYKSTYNSDLSEYTVPIERDDSEDYRRREEEAEKMAQEIESSSAYRSNVDKELSDGEEEEEAFSAVSRPTTEINNNNNNASNNNPNMSNTSIGNKEYHGKNDKYLNNRRPYSKQMIQRTSSGGSGGSGSNPNLSTGMINQNQMNNSGYHKQNRYQQQQMQSSQQMSSNQQKSSIERHSSLGTNTGGVQNNSSNLSYTNRRKLYILIVKVYYKNKKSIFSI